MNHRHGGVPPDDSSGLDRSASSDSSNILSSKPVFPEHGAMRIVSRRYHLHFPGLVYIATTVMLAFGAVQSQNNLLFWAFGIAVAGLLVSGIVSGSALMGLQMARLPIADTPVGKGVVIGYVLRNRNRVFPAMALCIEELDPRGRPGTTPLSFPAGSCELVAPGCCTECRTSARALVRGPVTLNRVRVWTTYPFGLTRKSVTFELAREVLVLPHTPRLRNGALEQLMAMDQRGVQTTAARGLSDEFWSLREYRAGDPTRSVAWKASARSGQLIVRQTAALTPVRVWVQIGEGDSEFLEKAIALAAGIIARADETGWSIGLYVPGAGVAIPPRQGTRHALGLARALAMMVAGASSTARTPGPKAGEAVVVIGASGQSGASRGRRVITLDEGTSLLEPGQSLVPPPAPDGIRTASSGLRLIRSLFGRERAGP